MCPVCENAIPAQYVREHEAFPPVPLSLIGWSGHGKTVFLTSLLHQLDHAGEHGGWRDFHWGPLTESGIKFLREAVDPFSRGVLPDGTKKVFPSPVILRLDGIPKLGRSHVLVFDTSGEAFGEAAQLRKFGKYVGGSPTVVWFLSPGQIKSSVELHNNTAVYRQAMSELGGDARQQDLLLVLTMVDRLAGTDGCPDEIDEIATGQLDHAVLGLREWRARSRRLLRWLESQPTYGNFVRELRGTFREVFCVAVSATGSEPEGKHLPVDPVPRAVLQPLLLTISLARRRRRHERVVRFFRRLFGRANDATARAASPPRPQPVSEPVPLSGISPPLVDGDAEDRDEPTPAVASVPAARAARPGAALVVALIVIGLAVGGYFAWGKVVKPWLGEVALTAQTASLDGAQVRWQIPASWSRTFVRKPLGRAVRQRWTASDGVASVFVEMTYPDDGASLREANRIDRKWRRSGHLHYRRVLMGWGLLGARRARVWEFVLMDPRQRRLDSKTIYYLEQGRTMTTVGFVAPAALWSGYEKRWFERVRNSIRLQ
jgi:hypothetical protein